MTDQIIRPNAPSVVAEIIDGEAVIMNLSTGHYFSTQGAGSELWSLVEGGVSEAGLAGYLQQRYRLEAGEAATGAETFLSQLREHDLVVAATADAPSVPARVPDPSAAAYAPPVLNAYSDMEDLLLLDPIHDVGEAGWPMPKPADS